MAEHTHSVIHVDQAEKALAAYREFVRKPGPIVVGRRQGSSVLGPVYEYAFLIDADLKRRNIRERVPITLVTPEPWPGHLGLGGEGASRGAVKRRLKTTKISVICNALTTRVDKDSIDVVELNAAGNVNQTHSCPTPMRCTGRPSVACRSAFAAPGLVNDRGLVVVDEYLRNPDYPNVFALGACVAQPASWSRRRCRWVRPTRCIPFRKPANRGAEHPRPSIGDAPLVSHVPQRAKWLSDMGDTGATYLSEPQVPLRDINWMRQGRWVHQAKVDFEKYFVNKIRLQPSGGGAVAASGIANVMSRVCPENRHADRRRCRRVPARRWKSGCRRIPASSCARSPGRWDA
jgi:sulfide:quinone oxidoreductase